MSNLIQIEREQRNLLFELEENGGELTPEIENALQINEQNFQSQVLHVGELIEQQQVRSEAVSAKIHQLQTLLARVKASEESLKRHVLNAMETFNTKAVYGHTATVMIRQSERVIVDDNLPKEWKRIKVTYEPDKVKIKEAIKAGATVLGAVLVPCKSLIIK